MRQLANFFIMQCIIAYRSKTALFWSFLYPLAMLVLMLSVFGDAKGAGVTGDDPRLMTVTGVFVITIMSGGIFALTTVLAADFQSGVYKRLKVTDLNRFHVTIGLMLRQLIIIVLGIMLVTAGAAVLFSVYPNGNFFSVLLLIFIGSVLFSSVGIIIANLCSRPQTAIAIANAIFLIMIFLSGSTFPKTFFPDWLAVISQTLPASYLFDLIESQLFYGESLLENSQDFLVLSAMCLIAFGISVKTFKWE
ncbi:MULTISPECIES: ABC transporter permease [Rheinheimera]|uniref:Transport permease protein n=1 Tax=Rheinheimera maricola TaxID=2793282 RepID=A0ABS7XC64_9GAMM|nr:MULTISPECIES: ABC transporter permease [Rheinheimera]MBZ9613141.1 ABC transporter permease [Rheinheimera maricola]